MHFLFYSLAFMEHGPQPAGHSMLWALLGHPAAASRCRPGHPPCRDPQDTRLSSAEQQKLLADASGQPASGQRASGAKVASPGAAEAAAPTGRTWPYKGPAPWGSGRKGGSRGSQPTQQRRWRPYVPWRKLAVLLLLLAGAPAVLRPARPVHAFLSMRGALHHPALSLASRCLRSLCTQGRAWLRRSTPSPLGTFPALLAPSPCRCGGF